MRFHNSNSVVMTTGILAAALACGFNTGCSGTSSSTGPSDGGAGAMGGGSATGGAPISSGGASMMNATGGARTLPTGGAPTMSTGGAQTIATGGAPTTPSGGAPTSATGGARTTATGGSVSGGSLSTGGKSAISTGGSPPTFTGGASSVSTGGVSPTGGAATSGTGGASQPATCNSPTTGHYQMEDLDRGVVAVTVTGGVYIGWRMMGYEYDTNAANVAYNLYRDGTKVATVTNSTNYLDPAGKASSSYSVSAVISGTECAQSAGVTPLAQNYITIPLTPPTGTATYNANDGATGDLDGDGKLDIVLKWDPSDAQDNANAGITSDVFIDGYTLAGQRLWRIDLGPNIRAGAHYTQMSVYDFDGDGKAEVVVKTAPGTKDSTGNFLSTGPAAGADNSQIYRNTSGYILTGPEWITVFSGATGKELATINYPVPRGTVSAWGDTYGNRVNRFNGGFAFVKDGGVAKGLPSIIQGRGYYTRLTVSALTYRNGVLAKNWVYDSVTSLQATGAGAHSEMAADVNSDGAQEIITGQTTINSDGTLRCQSGFGHGDAIDVTELIPGKGITVFSIHEGQGGSDAHNASTCTPYYENTQPGVDSNRGRAEYVGPGNENGASCYCASCAIHEQMCADGTQTGLSPGSNFVIYWDADEWRELENANSITKASGGTLLTCAQCSGDNGTKNTPTLTADLLGDWREEIVWRQSDNLALRVYTTTDVTARRIYTLMHDPTYRSQVNFEQSAYNQPPHTGWRISPNMAAPPKPDIFIVKRK